TSIPSGCVLNNNAHSNYAPYSGSTGSFRTDAPGFLKADLTSAAQYGVTGDWRIAATSPLVGKGVTNTYLVDDRDGKLRHTPPSIGAYESGTAVVTPPVVTLMKGTMSVNAGATYAVSNTVVVNSVVSGATEMRVDTGSGWQTWSPFAASKAVTLSGDGAKTVKAEYRNASGGTLLLSDTIVLDTAAPTGTMVLNHGKISTTTTTFDMGSSVTGATQMRVDSGTGWSAWMSYTTLMKVTVPAGAGKKLVTAEYRDAAGNVLSIWHTVTLL
ncbi:MAG TPA: hypothetical protein VLA05_09605, partial [Coriobacteriia bacterium]|nr:hypothetical protein [Coriobacteriia bacterium]